MTLFDFKITIQLFCLLSVLHLLAGEKNYNTMLAGNKDNGNFIPSSMTAMAPPPTVSSMALIKSNTPAAYNSIQTTVETKTATESDGKSAKTFSSYTKDSVPGSSSFLYAHHPHGTGTGYATSGDGIQVADGTSFEGYGDSTGLYGNTGLYADQYGHGGSLGHDYDGFKSPDYHIHEHHIQTDHHGSHGDGHYGGHRQHYGGGGYHGGGHHGGGHHGGHHVGFAESVFLGKTLALKTLLLPLAGFALLGAAAALVTNPVLLQLGVVAGKKRRRRRAISKPISAQPTAAYYPQTTKVYPQIYPNNDKIRPDENIEE